MAQFNYPQICSNLLESLPEKQKKIISRRFALRGRERETLESIGKDYGITRERIRQIEKDGFLRLKPKTKQYQKVFQYFQAYLKKAGGLKKEDLLLEKLGGEIGKNQVYFLLNLAEPFERFTETEEIHSLWTINRKSLDLAKKVINSLFNKLKKIGRPLSLKELSKTPIAYLEISKKIQKNSENLFGLKDWPEINPRGIKDKAYLVLKKENKPLHFSKLASLIESALPQTVHNELIKDSRFVLVGRGLYALGEWGYRSGYVKDIISQVLKEAGKPLTKEEILEKVLSQRLVKENTILLNLSNKKYFSKVSEDRYTLKTKIV